MFEKASCTVQSQLKQLMVWDLFVQSHIFFTILRAIVVAIVW
jgi:hypothetical protein